MNQTAFDFNAKPQQDSKMQDTQLTPASLELFRSIADEKARFGDDPYLEDMPPMSHADNGNMTDLKRRGLIDVYETDYGKHLVKVTSEGTKLALSLGLDIDF
jgi:hypothetical protein